MSDTATATETQVPETTAPAAPAVEAPQPAAAPEATPPPAPAPEKAPPAGPMGRREARAAARARGSEIGASFTAQRAETDAAAEPPVSDAPERVDTDTDAEPAEVVIDEKGRKHDRATGKFLPESGETDATTDTPAAETRAAETQPDPKPAEARANGISVPISPDHPIRGMGLEAFTASNPAEEQAIRALLNGTYSRRQEVEQLTAQLAEERRLRIQMESSQAATSKWQQTPEYKAAVERYNDIADTVGEDAANAYWKGIQSDLQALQESEFNERWGAVEQEQTAQAAEAWASEAWRHTEAMPAELRSLPDFQRWFSEELQVFDARVERGHFEHLKRSVQPQEFPGALQKEFAASLRRRIATEPSAAKVIRQLTAPKPTPAPAAAPATPAPSAEEQARREEEIARKAVEDFKRQMAESRQATPPHPMGTLAHATRDERAVQTGEGEVDTASMSPEQRRRHFRTRARSVGRAHFNQ